MDIWTVAALLIVVVGGWVYLAMIVYEYWKRDPYKPIVQIEVYEKKHPIILTIVLYLTSRLAYGIGLIIDVGWPMFLNLSEKDWWNPWGFWQIIIIAGSMVLVSLTGVAYLFDYIVKKQADKEAESHIR